MSSLQEPEQLINNNRDHYPRSVEQMIRFPSMENARDVVAELSRDLYGRNFLVTFLEKDSFDTSEPLPISVYTPDELKNLLTKIQAALGVSTSDLAEILGVQRQTIYAWNREENTPKEHNIARLQELDRKADEWNKLSSYPAKSAIKVKLHNEKSLFDLLTAEVLEHNKITKAMSEVAHLVNEYFERLNKRANGVSKSQAKLAASEYDLLALESVELSEEE